MSSDFVKIYSTILASSIWSEDSDTKVVWITMLAMAGPDGLVRGSVPGIARIAGVSVESCRTAISKFEAPDPDSVSPEEEGRRARKVEGGWLLINHAKYREMRTEKQVKDSERKQLQRQRDRLDKSENGEIDNVTCHECHTESREVAPEAEAEYKDQIRSDLQEQIGSASEGDPPSRPVDFPSNRAILRGATEIVRVTKEPERMIGFWCEVIRLMNRHGGRSKLRAGVTFLKKGQLSSPAPTLYNRCRAHLEPLGVAMPRLPRADDEVA